MSYKRQLIILFFLLISSYSFSAKAESEDHSIDCSRSHEIQKSSDVFNEKVIMMNKDIEIFK